MRFLKLIYQSNELLRRMGYSDIIMLPFSPLFGKVSVERWIPMTDIDGGIEQSIS